MKHSFLLVFFLFTVAASEVKVIVDQVNVTLQTETVTVNEESYKHLGLYESDHDLTLNSRITSDTEQSLKNVVISWRNKHNMLSYANGLSERYSIFDNLIPTKEKEGRWYITSTLLITKPFNDDVADYEVNVTRKDNTVLAQGIGSFYSPPLVRMKIDDKNVRDVGIWPGDGVTVFCDAQGNPKPTIQWSRSLNSSFTDTNFTISLSNLQQVDREFLVCTAKNSRGTNLDKLFLRVKNPMAFVVPLIALLVQCAILGIIVFAYEYLRKKRAKSD